MLRLAVDENFNNNVVRGLQRLVQNLDIVRVQDEGLAGKDDPSVLEWAAQENRVLVSHDVSTLIAYAEERVVRGEPMAGLIEVPRGASIRQVIDDLLLIAECGVASDLKHQVLFLPL